MPMGGFSLFQLFQSTVISSKRFNNMLKVR